MPSHRSPDEDLADISLAPSNGKLQPFIRALAELVVADLLEYPEDSPPAEEKTDMAGARRDGCSGKEAVPSKQRPA